MFLSKFHSNSALLITLSRTTIISFVAVLACSATISYGANPSDTPSPKPSSSSSDSTVPDPAPTPKKSLTVVGNNTDAKGTPKPIDNSNLNGELGNTSDNAENVGATSDITTTDTNSDSYSESSASSIIDKIIIAILSIIAVLFSIFKLSSPSSSSSSGFSFAGYLQFSESSQNSEASAKTSGTASGAGSSKCASGYGSSGSENISNSKRGLSSDEHSGNVSGECGSDKSDDSSGRSNPSGRRCSAKQDTYAGAIGSDSSDDSEAPPEDTPNPPEDTPNPPKDNPPPAPIPDDKGKDVEGYSGSYKDNPVAWNNEMLRLLNKKRAEKGAGPLTYDASELGSYVKEKSAVAAKTTPNDDPHNAIPVKYNENCCPGYPEDSSPYDIFKSLVLDEENAGPGEERGHYENAMNPKMTKTATAGDSGWFYQVFK